MPSLETDTTAVVRIALHPLRRRRGRLLQAIMSHAPAAATLLGAAIVQLRSSPFPAGAELALALTALLAGSWQALVIVQELREAGHHELVARRLRRSADATADDGMTDDKMHADAHDEGEHRWLHVPSLAVSLVYAAEAWLHWSETGHITRPYVLAAVGFAVLGAGGYRAIARRRASASALTVDAAGIALRMSWREHDSMAWRDVTRVEDVHSALRFIAATGRELMVDGTRIDHGKQVLDETRAAIGRFAPHLSAASAGKSTVH